MSTHLIIVENTADWKPTYPNMQVVTAKDYLAQPEYFELKNAKVINLSRGYRYLSRGYYCSLLAEARHHKVIPTVRTLRDLSSKAIYSLDIDCLDRLLQQSFEKAPDPNTIQTIEITILFGSCDKPALQKLARQIFATFACPLMKVEFRHQGGKWVIETIKPLSLNNLKDDQDASFIKAVESYTSRRWFNNIKRPISRYDLAILYNPKEEFAPSNPQALEKFVEAGKKLGIDVDLITKRDYSRLAEYDALFIRETTNIEHHTYRFSKKAESEGLVVIDDPDSILRCTNKVYLAELLKANDIPAPKTLILQKDNYLQKLENGIPYPVVLKIPDGSFSRGVFKAANKQEVADISTQLFKDSDIILAQEYLYTPFDWRIGILNRKPLFACQYFMSGEHWQVVQHDTDSGNYSEGGFCTLPIEKAPKEVVKAALKAARLIGDGLYGVDIKCTDKGVFVIEINDNPNIDEGIEDVVLKDELYRIIIQEFIRRLDEITRNGNHLEVKG